MVEMPAIQIDIFYLLIPSPFDCYINMEVSLTPFSVFPSYPTPSCENPFSTAYFD